MKLKGTGRLAVKIKSWITGPLPALGVLTGTVLVAAPAHAAEERVVWHQVNRGSGLAPWVCGRTYILPQLSYQACIRHSATPEGFPGYRPGILVHNRHPRRTVPVVGTDLQIRITNEFFGIRNKIYRCPDSSVAPDDLVMCWPDEVHDAIFGDVEVRAFAQSGTGATVGSPDLLQ